MGGKNDFPFILTYYAPQNNMRNASPEKFKGCQVIDDPSNGCRHYDYRDYRSDYCTDTIESDAYKNICDGSKEDCEAKGKAKCSSDPYCYGIMYGDARRGVGWSQREKGVMVCASRELCSRCQKEEGRWYPSIKCTGKNTIDRWPYSRRDVKGTKYRGDVSKTRTGNHDDDGNNFNDDDFNDRQDMSALGSRLSTQEHNEPEG